jgi:hypothetical protein
MSYQSPDPSMSDLLGDLEDDDLDAVPVKASAPMEVHTEICGKCRGTGRYLHHSSLGSVCFACNGAGKFTYKTSKVQREKAKAQRTARKEKAKQDSLDAFKIDHPSAHAWIIAKMDSFSFAMSMFEAIKKWGSLTPGQLGAIDRCMAKDAERTVETAKQVKAGFAYPRIAQLFRGKLAKLDFGDVCLSLKNDQSVIWVLYQGACCGAVDPGTGGTKFFAKYLDNREVLDTCKERMLAVEADPLKAAIEYGRLSGRCCVCSRLLTNEESIEAGIGPICSSRLG